MTKRFSILLALTLVLCFELLCSCECNHSNVSLPTCDEKSICLDCQNELSAALGHNWSPATCTTPKTCSTCNQTEGTALGHNWSPATCTTPKTCSTCNQTEGTALGHNYQSSITTTATCDRQGEKQYACNNCRDSYSEKYTLTEYQADEIFNITKNSVGEIITYDKNKNELALGTGFVYSSDGKIITNYHVMEDAYSAEITINEKTYQIQSILAYDKTIDLIVLKINATNLSPLTICKKDHAFGKPVYAIGSSRGLTSTFSQGIITYNNRELDGVIYVQHDAAISNGNSGGPLINQYGEVIGINTLTIRDSQNLNFAIHASEFDNLVFSETLTVAQFYEKECNKLNKIKNYLISEGTYNSENNTYTLTLGISFSDDYSRMYTREAQYDVESDSIWLAFFIDSDYVVMIKIDEIDGVYEWLYLDKYDYAMTGTIYANTYSSSSLLGYSSTNITYSSLITSTRKLASSMVNMICLYLNSDFASIGVTAYDLGFYYY